MCILQRNNLFIDCEVEWLVEPTPMDTGGAVAFAVKRLGIKGNFLLTNADTWLGSGYEELYHSQIPSMAVVKVKEARRYGQVQFDKNNCITLFKEKNNSKGPGWINAGLYHLSVEMFDDWNQQPFSLERSTFPTWASSRKLKAVTLNADFVDIGSPVDYFRFCRWVELGKEANL